MKKIILRIMIIIMLIFAIIGMVLGISIYYSATTIIVTHYSLNETVTSPIRIVHLTDLHNKEFGEDNIKLVEAIEAQNPDLIFMTGDMLNGNDENKAIICALIEKLCLIAPVYYGYGNHEKEWEERFEKNLVPYLTDAGAIVLDCAYLDVEVNGEKLRIGGYYGYYRQPGMVTKDEQQKEKELAFADEFEDTDDIKLLLCHIPTAWVDWNYIDKYPVDVVFSGHYHGGQIKIPFVGGLYAPYVGLFPEYTEGVFVGLEATDVLSTGLGAGYLVPRINNPAELVVVDLLPEK